MNRLKLQHTIGLAAGLLMTASAFGQGQVSGAGATLFVDFFKFPASTNDYIDVDGDGIYGPIDTNNDNIPDTADQLAIQRKDFLLGPYGDNEVTETWWVFQYRSVGSVEGFGEFVDSQLCGWLPENPPSERGIINRYDFAVSGVANWVGPPGSCSDDTDGDGIPNASGTPVCIESIDFANADVTGAWVVQGPAGLANWNAKPTSLGYGQNARESNGITDSQRGYENLLETLARQCDPNGPVQSLNADTANPDNFTIFGTGIAYSPISTIANRGTGLSKITFTDVQQLFTTGRRQNGENLSAGVRDVGSGTRNGWANSHGIDPSWCIGDGVGPRRDSSTYFLLGPSHQTTNCGGSGLMEDVVQNSRLAIGFTGLVGGSRSIADATAGKYEILSEMKDIDGDGNGNPDSTRFIRPSVHTVLFNGGDPNDPNDPTAIGWQVGGIQTLSTVGNPNANRDSGDPLYNAIDPPMVDQNTADWLNNMVSSIVQFTDPNGDPNKALLSPGQVLADDYFLTASVPFIPQDTPQDPTKYIPNPNFNASLRAYILANTNVPATPAYGSINAAGRTPIRRSSPVFDPTSPFGAEGDPNAMGQIYTYNDGSVNGNYYNYFTDGPNTPSITGGGTLNSRNAIAGDFDGDADRDLADIAPMMVALNNPAAYATNAAYNTTSGNPVVPQIIGDFDGDGNFNVQDARYFADGLAMDGTSGNLDRKQGFTAVDNGSFAATGTLNYFGATLATGKPYAAGDSRGDVAGRGFETPGHGPTGWDGAVDAQDIDYVCANFGDWSVLDEAVGIDLSCDMNGDLVVDADDITEIVVTILGTQMGDLNFDGHVDLTDLGILLGNYGNAGGWEQGDVSCDGVVDLTDLGILLGNYTG